MSKLPNGQGKRTAFSAALRVSAESSANPRLLGALCFIQLPRDILARVTSHLAPSDIHAFRKTCKIARTVTEEKSVWVHALRGVIAAGGYRAFLPTFHDHAENMNRLAIEFASFMPDLFTARLIKHAKTPGQPTRLPPASIRILPCHPGHPPFIYTTLVLGGRYLTTVSVTNLLEMWDLGHGAAELASEPIASLHVREGSMEQGGLDFAICQSQDGEALRVQLGLNGRQPDEPGRLHVYEIRPQDGNPRFQLLRTLMIGAVGPLRCCSMSTEWTAWDDPDSEHMIIWDYEGEKVCTFICADSQPPGRTGSSKFLLPGDRFLVACRGRHIAIYKIPPLEKLEGNRLPEGTPAAMNHPVLEVLLPISCSATSSPAFWESGTSFHITGKRDNTNVTQLYDMDFMTGTSGALLPIPILQAEAEGGPNIEEGDIWNAVTLHLSGRLAAVWQGEEGLNVRFLTDSNVEDTCVWKWRDEDLDPPAYDMCQFSGRFCIATGNEVRILDFLRRPKGCCGGS